MTFVAAAFFCGLATMLPGQALLQIFTSADGAFAFKYPGLLVHCVVTNQKTGGVSWSPEQSCAAYSPVCDDTAVQGNKTVACFAYPKAKFQGYPGFEAAAFSVAEVKESTNERSCLDGSPNWGMNPGGSGRNVSIHNVNFKAFETQDAGMGNYLEGDIYRAFHRNTCYELNIRVATANEANFDPPIKKFTPQDLNEVKGRLEQARDSFTFLK
jgi:hypothetical protein